MPLHSCAEPNSIKFDFGAMADSDGVLASNLIWGNQLSMWNICIENIRILSKSTSYFFANKKAIFWEKQIHSQDCLYYKLQIQNLISWAIITKKTANMN